MGNGSYSYDARGETTGETVTLDGSSYSFSFGYNDAGQPTSLTYSDGEVLSLSYGGTSGWLASATTPAGSSTALNLATNLTYTGIGGVLGQPSGANMANGTYSFAASADADLRPSAMSLALSPTRGGTTVFASNRTYDGVGNVQTVATTLQAGTDNQAFCYDEQNRLTWAGAYSTAELACGGQYTPGSLSAAYYSTGHTYDTLDRLTSATGTGGAGSYSYGDPAHLHAVTSTSSGYSASYDAAGNMTCRALTSATTCAGSTPTGQKLSYDNEGRLVGWQNTPTTPTSTATDAYDGEGNRVAQQTTTTSGGGGMVSTTDYIAGGLEEVGGSSGSSLTKYETVPGLLTVLIRGTGASESVHYLATDGLGSVSEELDGQGNVLGAQLYGPYGSLRYGSGVLLTSRGYTGQYADAVSGLDDYGARYYDPTVGQFTSADTLLAGGLNRYAYVGNNPETASDPSGHMVLEGDEGGASGLYNSGLPNAPLGGGEGELDVSAGTASAEADLTLTAADGTQTQIWDDGNMVTITGPDGEFEGTMAAADDPQLNGSLEVDPATETQQADELKASAHAGEPQTEHGPGTTGETPPGTTPTNPNEPNTPTTPSNPNEPQGTQPTVNEPQPAEPIVNSPSGGNLAEGETNAGDYHSSLVGDNDDEEYNVDSPNKSSGQDYRLRGRYAKRGDKQIEQIARRFRMTNKQRWEFGDYIESLKTKAGRSNDANYTWGELLQLAADFLGEGGDE